MKKRTLKPVLFAVAIAAFASCKKNKSTSPQDMIVGTWRETSIVDDNNHNGVMDDAAQVDTAWAHATWVFKSNDTMVFTYFSEVVHFSYQFLNNNASIQLTKTDPPVQSSTEAVVTINSTTFTIKDTTGGHTSWTTWTKQ